MLAEVVSLFCFAYLAMMHAAGLTVSFTAFAYKVEYAHRKGEQSCPGVGA